MFNKKTIPDYLYFDIETIPAYDSFSDMPFELQKIWILKHHQKASVALYEERKKKRELDFLIANTNTPLKPNSNEDETLYPTVNEAYIYGCTLYPEFSKVFCISFGVFDKDYNKIIGTVYQNEEKIILETFISTLKKHKNLNLFGYNIQDFDIPFLLKRMWINGLTGYYPPQIRMGNAKPWTVKHIDLLHCYKSFTWSAISFDLLCQILNIPSPKDKFSNSEFSSLVINKKISHDDAIAYCEKDVNALMEAAIKLSEEDSNYFSSK